MSSEPPIQSWMQREKAVEISALLFRRAHNFFSKQSFTSKHVLSPCRTKSLRYGCSYRRHPTVSAQPCRHRIQPHHLRFLRRSEFLGSFVSIPTLSRGEFMGTSAQWRSPKNHLGYCVKVRSYPSYLPHFPTYCIANTAANLATDSYPYHPTLSSTRCLPNPPPHIFTQEE